MPKFVLAYHGSPQFKDKADGEIHMIAWRSWAAALGAAVVDPGMPVGQSVTLSQSGLTPNGGANPIVGITILEAPNMDAAVEMATPCPHISAGGSIEIAQAVEM